MYAPFPFPHLRLRDEAADQLAGAPPSPAWPPAGRCSTRTIPKSHHTNYADLTATDAAALIRAGDLTPTALVEAALVRIEALEPMLRAWVFVDHQGALAHARTLSEEARSGVFRGPLHGIPAGVKDIFHVGGMVTTAGAGTFVHVRASDDAASVARLRRAGAIMLGKTTTTEFAYLDPTQTVNPWNPEHTPGGSSAGSAAAVGARMVPLALGSQTIGSTLRPAAYCGIVGFKPTHGRISLDGVHPLAPSLDHVGIFCRSVADAALTYTVLTGSKNPTATARRSSAPRIGLINGAFSARSDAQTRANIISVTNALVGAGAETIDIVLPASFAGVADATSLIIEAEAAAVHAENFTTYGSQYRPKMRALIERGMQRTAVPYAQALDLRRRFRADLDAVWEHVDVLMMPTTPAPAPQGLDSTGDPTFCAPWSFAGVPAISLPSGLTGDGLPLGLQLVAGPGAESTLLDAAAWCEQVIAFREVPR